MVFFLFFFLNDILIFFQFHIEIFQAATSPISIPVRYPLLLYYVNRSHYSDSSGKQQRSAPRGGIRAVQTTVCLCLYLQATLINILSAWSEDAAPSLGACEEGEDLSPREMFVGRAGPWSSFLSSRRVAEQCRGTASPAWSLLCGPKKKKKRKLKPLLLSPSQQHVPFPGAGFLSQ